MERNIALEKETYIYIYIYIYIDSIVNSYFLYTEKVELWTFFTEWKMRKSFFKERYLSIIFLFILRYSVLIFPDGVENTQQEWGYIVYTMVTWVPM